uniref:Uncharacterized protein n=1 Tax=Cacopsylla melanoneura TaxID=428564 RepID=A0A8D8R635_9HEMI
MEKYTTLQRTKLVELYFQNGQSITLTQENRIISQNSEFPWPANSPEMTAPDFFLWAYLKKRVYVNKPRTLQELKNNITREVQAPNILRKVMESALERDRICETENGHHLRDVIFHV